MIEALFYFSHGIPRGFEIRGHAGWAESGRDIVCAAVSSAVQLTCNTVTEFFSEKAQAEADSRKNTVSLSLPESCDTPDDPSVKLIDSLRIHLSYISEEHPGTVKVIKVPGR